MAGQGVPSSDCQVRARIGHAADTAWKWTDLFRLLRTAASLILEWPSRQHTRDIRQRTAFHLTFSSLNILDVEHLNTAGQEIDRLLLTQVPWRILDKAANTGVLADQLHTQRVMAVRPEMVIVSTLQQLLQAQDVKRRDHAFSALEAIGAIIRDVAASKDVPREAWLDPRVWMNAVLLSAGPPSDDKNARPLYNADLLEQLLVRLGIAPKRHDSTIPFFRGLLQVSSFSTTPTGLRFPTDLVATYAGHPDAAQS